jgi:polyhydroxyalkanoate synthesis regulator phasin/type IV secretory pathway VirB10-like protein
MAFKFPGLKFFAETSAKSRVAILLASVAGVGLLIYVSMKMFGGPETATGPSRVAGAPTGLQSVPGSKELSPQYYRTLVQANVQAAQQAQISGGSAVPTLINTAAPQATSSTQSCTVLCPGADTVNIEDEIKSLLKNSKLSQKDGDRLAELAQKNVSDAEYAAYLDELVRQGKLTPEQARQLLEKYKKQHANALLTSSASAMDSLIKSGQLPLNTANDLLDLQKRKLTPAEYAAYLDRLVKEGKLSPEAAAQLLAQYTQQYAAEAAKEGAFAIKQMARAGQMTPEVAKMIEDLQNKNVPADQYENTLSKLVTDGKITPDVARKLAAQYRTQRVSAGSSSLLNDMLAKGGAAAEAAKRLLNMQANNASLTDYTEALKQTVAAGLIKPEEAASLLQQYQAMLTPFVAGAAPGTETVIPGAEDFAKLQQNLQAKAPVTTTPAAASQFQTAVAEQQADYSQERQQQVQQLASAMANQATNLLTSWKVTPMKHEGAAAAKPGAEAAATSSLLPNGSSASSSTSLTPPKPSLIKAGTIAYAVLDTAVDSDYPDTPVMATVVQGPLKGAKLLGKLSLAQGKDKVSLNFTQMDKEGWPNTKTISAFAVDPDTARTVMASNVDYHYLKRYGAIMATSFLSGYSSAITQAGQSTTGIFGTSTTHNNLSPANKIAVGLGQIGTNLSSMMQQNVNLPATVKVNSGVGLGILFVSDVPE